MDHKSGNTFNDLYELKEDLGKGSFAGVKKAIEKSTGTSYAVKIMKKKAIKSQYLERETEIMKKVNHPNVITLHGIFEEQQNLYLVLQYAPGGVLFDQLIKRESFSELDASKIIRQVLEAVQYLHSLGIVHRDLKLENLLCADDSDKTLHIYVADFGLSKIIEDEQQTTTQVGSMEYTAPEVLLGVPYQKSVDLWSIGVITYALLTGCFPFFAPNHDNAILYAKIQALDYSWKDFPDVSEDAKDFIKHLLVKDPADRYTPEQALAHHWIKGDGQNKSFLKSAFSKILHLKKPKNP